MADLDFLSTIPIFRFFTRPELAVKDDFECRQMPDTHLRGKTQDLKIYEVVSMKTAAAVV